MAAALCGLEPAPPDDASDSSSPTAGTVGGDTSQRSEGRRKKIVILMRASFFVHATEGVHLATEESETEDDPLEQYFIDSQDDELYDDDDDWSLGCGNWKRGCKQCRPTSSNKKPKITPHKIVKPSTQRRDLKTKANVELNAKACKENNERRLQKQNIQRLGLEIYHRRSDCVDGGKKPTKMTAPRSYAPHKHKWRHTDGRRVRAEDHPAALRYELKDTSNDLSRLLVDIQHRDLSPEDYDLLLRLDESVAPKTVSETALASFETLTLESLNTLIGELCSICMEVYSESQSVKTLPCQHTFHQGCIDMWLLSASLNCPLDGIAVQS